MTSLASVKGPSVTVTFPPESRTRAPSAVGPSPPFPIIVPFLASSSLRMVIASISSLGGRPCFSSCLTIIINFIVSLLDFLGCEPSLRTGIDRPDLGSIYASNGRQRNRHSVFLFLKFFLEVLLRCRQCLNFISAGIPQ